MLEYEAIVAQAHHTSGDMSAVYRYPVELKPGPGRGLAPRAVTTSQILVCHDERVDPNLGSEFSATHKIRNCVCVPVLNHQANAIAFIEVSNRRDGGLFTQDDARALETLGLQASLDFQRSRLVDRLAEWSRSLEILLAFSAAVNQMCTDLRESFSTPMVGGGR